jgi:DNA-directed RNA polymerase specialized sigma24 family protein
VLAALPRVYGAAMAASSDAGVAEQVTERVLLADPGGDSGVLVERAVLLAVRTSPDEALARMREQEREVIALARLAGATTTRIAAVLALEPKAVRALMTSGLRAAVS